MTDKILFFHLELSRWAESFVEGTIKECLIPSNCFIPTDGPAAGLSTLESFHIKNAAWIMKYNQRLSNFISNVKTWEQC